MSIDEPTTPKLKTLANAVTTSPLLRLSQVIYLFLVKTNRMFGLVEASAWSDLCDSIVL